MLKKEIDDSNFDLLKYKTGFENYKTEVDRSNHTFRLELIKKLNTQYETEYFKLKDQLSLFANKYSDHNQKQENNKNENSN